MDNQQHPAELPEFRITSLRPGESSRGHDALLKAEEVHRFRMRKASYDQMLLKQPQAVLSYDDVDDGEKITVGSGTELEQRLQEPPVVGKRDRPSPYMTHSFNIEPSDDARRAWRERSIQEYQMSLMQDPQTSQIKVEKRQRAQATSISGVNLEQEANSLKHDLQDRISRLSAQMKSTTIGDSHEDQNASDKVSVTTTADAVSPRTQYVQRCQPPSLVPQASTGAPIQQHGNHLMDAQGTLTPQGTKLAQQAAAAIAQITPATSSAMASKLNAHARRWAAYSNINGSFKQPPAELSGGSQPSRAELDVPKPEGQPLLRMFEAELAKITKGAEISSTQKVEAQSSATKLVPSSLAGAEAATATAPPQSSIDSPADISRRSLKSLFEGIGELAAQTLESNPDLAQRLTGAARAVKCESAASVKADPNPQQSVQPAPERKPRTRNATSKTEFIMTNEKATVAGAGELKWTSEQGADKHGFFCALQCPVDDSTCPIRQVVKELASRMETADAPSETNTRSKSSKPDKAHQATQTSSVPTASSKESKEDDKAAFEADRILAKRYVSYNNMWGPTKIQYLIRWVGHGNEHDVWYDAENLGGCKGLLDHYEKAIQKKRLPEVTELRKGELHAIHLRTAGDRMVASRKWEEPEEVEKHRRFHTDESFRHRQLKDLRDAQEYAVKKVKTMAPEPSKPVGVEARSSSLDAKTNANPATASSSSTLRHRKSWHPSSSTTPIHRSVSPTAAAEEKYPAISSFEAAHHGMKDLRRKSVPDFASASQGQPKKVEAASGASEDDKRKSVPDYYNDQHGLDFRHVEESRRAWLLDDSRESAPKDKSVRFDIKDPWVEKKKAQEAWESKQQEEESLYGPPEPSTSAKKEGKKPARYSSPPPPQPTAVNLPPEAYQSRATDAAKATMSSGDIWRELSDRASSVRRAKSLNFAEPKAAPYKPMSPFARSRLRFSTTDEPKVDQQPSHMPQPNDIARSAVHESLGPIRQKREPSALRRTASARFPSLRESLREARPSSSKRESMPPMSGAGLARSQSTKQPISTQKLGRLYEMTQPPMNFDDLLGPNPWAPDRRSASKASDPWSFLHDTAKGESSSLKYPAMTPTKAVGTPSAPIPAPPAAPMLHAPGLARRPDMRPFQEVPPAVKARNDAITDTIKNLMNMGYKEQESKFVAESADGNMDDALDMLQEDQQARHEGFESSSNHVAEQIRSMLGEGDEKEKEKERKVPGAF